MGNTRSQAFVTTRHRSKIHQERVGLCIVPVAQPMLSPSATIAEVMTETSIVWEFSQATAALIRAALAALTEGLSEIPILPSSSKLTLVLSVDIPPPIIPFPIVPAGFPVSPPGTANPKKKCSSVIGM